MASEYKIANDIERLKKATLDWYWTFMSDDILEANNLGTRDNIRMAISESKMINWGLVATENQVGPIWEIFSPLPPEERLEDGEEPAGSLAEKVNPDLLDFLMNGTAYIHTVPAIPDQPYSHVINEIAEGITWVSRARYIDSTLKERSATKTYLKELFESERWLVFVYFLSICDFSVKPGFNDTLSSGVRA